MVGESKRREEKGGKVMVGGEGWLKSREGGEGGRRQMERGED